MAKSKEYVLLTKHTAADGKIYEKGSSIELNDDQAANLVNKIRDPKEVVISNDNSKLASENAKLIKQLEALQAENDALTEQLDEATASKKDL